MPVERLHGPTLRIDPHDPRQCLDCPVRTDAEPKNIRSALMNHHRRRYRLENGTLDPRPLGRCRFCRDKGRKDNMTAHERTTHPGQDKKHPCRQCKNAGFQRWPDLDKHEKSLCPYQDKQLLEGWSLKDGKAFREAEETRPVHQRTTAVPAPPALPSSQAQPQPQPQPQPRNPSVPVVPSSHTPPPPNHNYLAAQPLNIYRHHQQVDPGFGMTHTAWNPFPRATFDPTLNHWTPLNEMGTPFDHEYMGYSSLSSQGVPGQHPWTYEDYLAHDFPLPYPSHTQDPFGDTLPSALTYDPLTGTFAHTPPLQSQLRWSLAKRLSPRQLHRYGRYLID